MGVTDAMDAAMSGTLGPDDLTISHQFTSKMYREVYPAISPRNPQNSAAGKHVLVTGATRGIGKSIALAWAEAGASSIVITGRVESLLKGVAAEITRISPETKVLALTSEAGSEDETKVLWSRVKSEIGIIDVLICNAGVMSEKDLGFPITGNIPPSQWWSDMNVNIHGPYLHIYNYLQQYLAEGKEPSGTIVNLTSGAAGGTMPGMSAYSISKLAALRMVEFLHAEHRDVRVFAVNPGLVATQMAFEGFLAQCKDPPELAGAFSVYLAAPRADHLRGRYLAVNWDVEEMEKYADEVMEKDLLTTAFIKAQLGPKGHPFES